MQYTYDLANQLKSVVQVNHPDPDPARHTTSNGYDGSGNRTSLSDANTHVTQNGFDLLNQLNQEALPVGQVQTRTYDSAGNLHTMTDYNGHTTTYTYDSLDRLLSKIPDPALNEPAVSFTYTATGKRATMTDASGTTTYTYDNLDRLKTKATPQGTLTYTYDATGNVASINSSNAKGISVNYTYDELNRLSTVIDNRLPAGHNTTNYTYDPASNLGTVTYPNGLQSTFTYNDLNRLTALNATKGSYTYTLGPTGNRLSGTESSGRTLNWSYDGIYRLTQETINSDPAGKNGTVGYGLDPVGNRSSQTSSLPGISSGSFTYDANDRLSTETYDNNGNTTVSGARTFAYDFENRVKSMNGGAVTIVYDGDGNRAVKTANGISSRYLVDDLNPSGYPQVVEELVSGTLAHTYTYGLRRVSQNQLLANSWTPSFYGYDGSGNTRLLTDIAGNVTDTCDYDGWGNAVNTTGTTPNAYLYRGEQYDSDLGVYDLRARYYNPISGRFLTRDINSGDVVDPASLHRYLYASGDPVNRIDPSGKATMVERGLLTGFVLASGVLMYEAESAKSVKCIWCEAASQLATALYTDLLAPGIRAVGEIAGRGICSVEAVLASDDSNPRRLPVPIPWPAQMGKPRPDDDDCKESTWRFLRMQKNLACGDPQNVPSCVGGEACTVSGRRWTEWLCARPPVRN